VAVATGSPLDEFRPGDPLFAAAQEGSRVQGGSQKSGDQAGLSIGFPALSRVVHQAGFSSLPGTITTIGLYMMELATGRANVATTSRKLAAISFWHKENKLPSPCSMKADRQLAQVYAGIRNN
jgi:hypothetical protein